MRRLALEHGCTGIVDVGAGRGELLTALAGLTDPVAGVGDGVLRLFGSDVVPRPPGLPSIIGWSQTPPGQNPSHLRDLSLLPDLPDLPDLPAEALDGALVIGWELLDVVPCPILELDDDGLLRVVLVEPSTGREKLGDVADPADQRWCERWWRIGDGGPGDRFEVGRTRDGFWAELLHRSAAGGAKAGLAVDYWHQLDARPALGSLTGFRAGRAVPPRPDGSMDLTAHVALDAVAAALVQPAPIVEQHVALRALGVRHQELLDPGALGGFGCLLTSLL